MNAIKCINTIVLLLTLTLYQSVPTNMFSHRCDPLKDATLTRVCKSKYPLEILKRYLDQWVEVDEPYAVYYINNDPERIFITFSESPLISCISMKFVDPETFFCEDSGKTIELPFGKLHCFQTNIKYLDELLEFCKNGNELANTYAALHYTREAHSIPNGVEVSKIKTTSMFVWLLVMFIVKLL